MKKFLLGLLVCVVLISGCTGENSSQSSFANCPNLNGIEQFAGYNNLQGYFQISDTGEQLFDSWKITGSYSLMGDIFSPCAKGSREGENVNYYYCKDITAKRIDDSGNIIDTKKVVVVLSLNYDQAQGKTTEKTYIETIC